MRANAVAAAALAQPLTVSVGWRAGSVVGVPTPRLEAVVPPFVPRYGPAAVTAKLDRAGEGYSAPVAALIAFAEEEEAVRNLQSGLTRTIRRLRALEQLVIPRLKRDARDVTVALEEDDRAETVRGRQATALRRTSWADEPNVTR